MYGFHFLDFVAFVAIWSFAWFMSPDYLKEDLKILAWVLVWIAYTIAWFIIFVYLVDLNVVDLSDFIHNSLRLEL